MFPIIANPITQSISDVYKLILSCIDSELHSKYFEAIRSKLIKNWMNNPIFLRVLNRVLDYEGLWLQLLQCFFNSTNNFLLLDTKKIGQQRKKLKSFYDTVMFIEKFFNDTGFDYRIIKYYPSVEYIPRDLDLLIRKDEKEDILKNLRDYGAKITSYGTVETSIEHKKLLKIDLYTDIIYYSKRFCDYDFFWDSPQKIVLSKSENILLKLPSPNIDFIITFVHAFFGHKMLQVTEFVYLKNYLKTFQKKQTKTFLFIKDQSKKYHWDSLLNYGITLLNNTWLTLLNDFLETNQTFPILLRQYDALTKAGIYKKKIHSTRYVTTFFDYLFGKYYYPYIKFFLGEDNIPLPLKRFIQFLLFSLHEKAGDKTT